MNFTLIRSMLYNLVKTYSGGVEAIWTEQSEKRPPRPYASLKISSGPMRVGIDDELRNDGTDFISTGLRKFTLSVQFFGAEAMENAASLMSGLELSGARNLMKTKNVGLTGNSGVMNLTELLENRFEQRAAIDFFMTTTDELVDDVSTIETVIVTNLDTGESQEIG